MLITKAFAATPDLPSSTSGAPGVPVMPAAPSAGDAFMWNMGMVAILVAMFYFLLIVPQQRRFKEHSKMLSGLKKGDRVITSGGLIGVIDSLGEGDEAVVDLGNNVKVTAVRSTLTVKDNPLLKKNAANDAKK